MKTITNLTQAELIAKLKDHKLIEVYQPGPFPQQKDGEVTITGPNWKLKAILKDGFIKELIK